MVSYVSPTTQKKYRPAGVLLEPHHALTGVTPSPDWQSHGADVKDNQFATATTGMQLQPLPPLTAPKLEPQHYREGEVERTDFDYFLHGRKRSKLHDSLLPAPGKTHVGLPSQLLPAVPLHHVSAEGSSPSSIYNEPQQSLARKSSLMLPPIPVPAHSVPSNPLDEPSPLGLTLRKTPSLLDLITLQLGHGCATPDAADSESEEPGLGRSNRVGKCLAPTGSAAQDKLKASNFPASTVKIGTWERVSRYEGDLVAKCYYAKRKLVWEVLDSGLKSKIEIQWSDIMAMKANCPENLPGSLDIEVSRPPLFFKETNPQPRKHTLWQATSDFTGGQATICKRHTLQFPEGVLNRHYEKLVQCDPRLKALVEGTLVMGSSPHYDQSDSLFEGHSALHHPNSLNSSTHGYDGLNNGPLSPLTPYSPLGGRLGTIGIVPDVEGDLRAIDMRTGDAVSPNSMIDMRGTEEAGNSDSEEYYVGEDTGGAPFETLGSLYSSPMAYDMGECKPSLAGFPAGSVSSSNRKILDEIAQVLLGDSTATLSSEQAMLLAAKMGSMQAILNRDFQAGPPSHPSVDGLQMSEASFGFYNTVSGRGTDSALSQGDNAIEGFLGSVKEQATSGKLPKGTGLLDTSFNSVMSCLSKNGSSGDLLMNLPRVASLPQLFESVSQVPVSRYERVRSSYMGIQ